MAGANKAGAMRMIANLQALRVETAQSDLKIADGVLLDAADRTRDRQKLLTEAFEGWHNALADRQPDLGHVRRMGDWLVAQETRLHAARLDQQIAQAQRDDRAVALAETTALHEVAVELTGRLRRRAAKAREEQRQQTTDDLHRLRRYSCPSR